MSGKHRFWLPLLAIILVARGFLPLAAHAAAQTPSAGSWTNVTGTLAGMPSECGNLTLVSTVPNSDTIIAGVALKGLWANTIGTTWSHLGSGAGSDTITNRPSWIVHDPAVAGVFWESGIYNGGGIYKSTDNGVTFHQLGSLSHNDYVSVDFGDPNRQTLLAGGHEAPQTVYRSQDGGQTWTNIGGTLPANTKFSSNPLIVSSQGSVSQTFVVNAQGYGQGLADGIFRTTNGGNSWQQVSALGPSQPPLVTSNGTIYWSLGGSLLKSTDSGVNWVQVGNALESIRPVELPDGRVASAGLFSDFKLYVMVSADGGSTWSPLGAELPYSPAGLVYSARRKAFYIWHWDCGGVVLPDAIMSLDYDVSGPIPRAPTGLKIIR